MARRRRRKNLSTGAWVAIGIGLGVVVPVVVIGGIFLYGVKRIADTADDIHEDFPDIDEPITEPDRPIPPIPPIN